MWHRHKSPLFSVALPLAFVPPAGPAHVRITTGGMSGPVVSLSGPAVEIGAGLVQRQGPNLFHSSREFATDNSRPATRPRQLLSGKRFDEMAASRVGWTGTWHSGPA